MFCSKKGSGTLDRIQEKTFDIRKRSIREDECSAKLVGSCNSCVKLNCLHNVVIFLLPSSYNDIADVCVINKTYRFIK